MFQFIGSIKIRIPEGLFQRFFPVHKLFEKFLIVHSQSLVFFFVRHGFMQFGGFLPELEKLPGIFVRAGRVFNFPHDFDHFVLYGQVPFWGTLLARDGCERQQSGAYGGYGFFHHSV
ncbi:MAG: hypothetical protein LUE08_06765 [Akkermansiaceae bacterium]|nr:hypothetical protein [Akkermansiaceae bacterium]